jgi:hypothetical protein
MKKPIRSNPSSEATSSNHGKKEGSWSFNLASESLFALGATEKARRVAYRTATGELRFLPL